jgi:hypothetical protein
MKIWSRGLGKMTLEFDLGSCNVVNEEEELVLKGKVGPPVNWEFWIRINREDVPGFMKVAMRRTSFVFAIKYFLALASGGLPYERNIGAFGRSVRVILGAAAVLLSLIPFNITGIVVLDYLIRLALFAVGIASAYQGLSGRCWIKAMGFFSKKKVTEQAQSE